MKIILSDIDPDDWVLAIRATKYLQERFQKDAWLEYGEHPNAKETPSYADAFPPRT